MPGTSSAYSSLIRIFVLTIYLGLVPLAFLSVRPLAGSGALILTLPADFGLGLDLDFRPTAALIAHCLLNDMANDV